MFTRDSSDYPRCCRPSKSSYLHLCTQCLIAFHDIWKKVHALNITALGVLGKHMWTVGCGT